MGNINDMVAANNTVYQKETDIVSDTLIYKGYAVLGTAVSSPNWTIKRLQLVGTVWTENFPIGQNDKPASDPQFIWNDRASLTYSNVAVLPTLASVSIASNNADATLAKVGDVVTVTVVSNKPLSRVYGTIDTIAVAGVNTGGLTWTISHTMTSADATGAVTFEVDFENMDGVKGTRVTAVTDGSSVTFDKTVATLGVVTIASDNDDTSLAKVGDTIVLMFIASEALMAKPNVSIAGHVLSAPAITQGVDATQWNAVYVMQAGDTNGVVTFTINAKDLAGNNISQVSATTNSSSVTFDKTAPVMVSATEISNFSLTFSLSEFALASTITKANDGGFVVFETGTPATTYAVSAVAPGLDNKHIVLTTADVIASAPVGVTVTYTAGGNGTVSDLAGNLLATDATGIETGPF